MQRTAHFHNQIVDSRLPEAARVLDDSAALHTAVDVLDADAAARNAPIGRFLCAREGPAPRLLGGHDDLDVVECEGQETEILEQSAARGQGIRRGLRDPLVVGATPVGVAQKEDREGGIDQQHIFHRMACFLATITACLLKRVLGARDAPFRPIVAKRGEAAAGLGAAAGDSAGGDGAAVGTTRAAASAAVTPRR
jgi:hypothetical protein